MKGYALSMEGRRRLIVSLEQTGLCAATLARSMIMAQLLYEIAFANLAL
jgi:hypothetical protein